MTADSPNPAPRPWYALSVADVIFLLATLVALRGMNGGLIDDPGMGWHIRNIDFMLAEGKWLTVDPFTDPRGGEPARWYANQWVGEILTWLGWKYAGLEGIAVFNALLIGLLGRWFYTAFLDDGAPWPVAVVATMAALVGTSVSWNARPSVLTTLFIFLTARFLVGLHEGRTNWRRALCLPPVFTLWANAHGGFVAGLVMIGFVAAVEFARAAVLQDRDGFRRGRWFVTLLAGCALATLLNPYGVGLYGWIAQLLGEPFFMSLHQEWQSPDFHGAGSMRFEQVFLLFPLLLALTARRPNVVELGLSILWLHFAFNGLRYVPLWVVVAAPLMVRSLVHIDYLRDLCKRMDLTTEPGGLFNTPPGRSGWLVTGLIAASLALGSKAIEGRVAAHVQKNIASKAIDALLAEVRPWQQQRGRRAVVLHSYGWGGYITWHGWPEVLNWIDDRNEVQGKARIEEYFELIAALPGWKEKTAHVDFFCLEPKQPLARWLATMPTVYREVYRDSNGVVFERLR